MAIGRRYYWKSKNGGGGVYPADSILGIDQHGVSPGAREIGCSLGMLHSFRSAAANIKRLTGIALSAEFERRIVEREAAAVRIARDAGKLKAAFTAADTTARGAGVPGPTRLYVGVDGVMAPMVRQEEKDRRRAVHEARRKEREERGVGNTKPLRPKRAGSDERYKEMKLGVFYDQSKNHRHAFATSGNHEALGLLLKAHAGMVGFDLAQQTISLTDGAEWIRWQLYGHLLRLRFMLLDFYHLAQHVHGTARCCLGETDRAKEWAGSRLEEFKTKGAAEPLAAINALGKVVRAKAKKESLRRLRNYITERLEMLDYPKALALGIDIGSGPTEAMCKNLTLRLKRTGMKWDADHAADMMNLVAMNESGQAPLYWQAKAA